MTLEKAKLIVASTEAFYEQTYVIDGQNVSIFNYRFATHNDFVEHNAFELRGLTFVNGVKYIALHKFFNLGQIPTTQYFILKDKEIKSIRVKEDGSMITFINVNGKIVPKTKMSFDNDQTAMVNAWLENRPIIKKDIHSLVENGYTPVFELVSPRNRIVLNYPETKLILLQLRDADGKYLDLSEDSKFSELYEIARYEPLTTLDDLIERAKTEENIEGWVVEFTDGTFIKIKTEWYFGLHGFLTTDLTREDFILQRILDETIDDLIGQLEKNDPRREYIDNIQTALDKFLNEKIAYVSNILKNFEGERKDLAIKYRQDELFSVIMKAYVSGNVQDSIVDRYKREVNSLESARTFLRDEVKFNESKV